MEHNIKLLTKFILSTILVFFINNIAFSNTSINLKTKFELKIDSVGRSEINNVYNGEVQILNALKASIQIISGSKKKMDFQLRLAQLEYDHLNIVKQIEYLIFLYKQYDNQYDTGKTEAAQQTLRTIEVKETILNKSHIKFQNISDLLKTEVEQEQATQTGN